MSWRRWIGCAHARPTPTPRRGRRILQCCAGRCSFRRGVNDCWMAAWPLDQLARTEKAPRVLACLQRRPPRAMPTCIAHRHVLAVGQVALHATRYWARASRPGRILLPDSTTPVPSGCLVSVGTLRRTSIRASVCCKTPERCTSQRRFAANRNAGLQPNRISYIWRLFAIRPPANYDRISCPA